MPAIADIQRAVAAHTGISVLELISHRRKHARPRQVAMFLARELTPHSYPAIGRAFHRDHSTVFHACRLIPQLMRRDDRMTRYVAAISAAITALSS